MKVIFITRESADMPAVRVRCHGFAQKLRAAGRDAEVLSFADDLGAKSGAREREMGWKEKIGCNLRACRRLKKEKNSILFLQRLHYHSAAPVFLHLARRHKLIFDLDDWEARESARYYFNGRISSSRAEMGIRFTAKISDFCVGASRFLRDYLREYNRNSAYIPTGVDTERFVPGYAGPRGAVVLSWMGTMHRTDNVENIRFLIGCFQELSRRFEHIRLEIAGGGIFAAEVQVLARQAANPRLVFKPWMNPDRIPEYLNTVDIGVMPLIQDTKFNRAKSPTRLFEYMAAAKPVVAGRIGEAEHVLEDGKNGFLARTKEEFIDKLAGLIADEDLRRQIGQEARRTVCAEYSLDVSANRLLEILRRL